MTFDVLQIHIFSYVIIFFRIDVRNLIATKVIPRCEKLKYSICYSIMKRIKKYMNTFTDSMDVNNFLLGVVTDVYIYNSMIYFIVQNALTLKLLILE